MAAIIAGPFVASSLAAGLGALAGLAGAWLLFDFTFVAKSQRLCARFAPLGAAESLDPVDRLAARFAAALGGERRGAMRDAALASARLKAEAQAAAEAAASGHAAARAEAERAIARTLKALAQGDLEQAPFAGELAQAFQAVIARDGRAAHALAASAGAMNEALSGVVATAQALKRRAKEQAARLASARKLFREAAESAEALAREDRQARHAGLHAAMAQRDAALELGANALDRVAATRPRLLEIAEQIQSFAFQTHLIALNANVEAARAGEAGRGIAIVAQELRALSQRTSEATSELCVGLGTLSTETDRQAAALRAAAAEVGAAPPARDAAASEALAKVAAEIDGAAERTLLDLGDSEVIGAAGRSLQDLVGKLTLLARHFRADLAEPDFAAAAPVASLEAARRRRAS